MLAYDWETIRRFYPDFCPVCDPDFLSAALLPACFENDAFGKFVVGGGRLIRLGRDRVVAFRPARGPVSVSLRPQTSPQGQYCILPDCARLCNP